MAWSGSHSAVADHHRRCKQIRDEVVAVGYKPKRLFVFLLNTAQFEFLLKEVTKTNSITSLLLFTFLSNLHTLVFLYMFK